MGELLIGVAIGAGVLLLGLYLVWWQYRKIVREAKNYERGLKMVPLLIHLPPSSDDIELGGRDARDVAEEAISQAQVMYNIVASTATKGFRSRIYGQRHMAFEIIANKGLIHYYLVSPLVLLDVVKQAILAAYPTARIEECEEHNLFNQLGKITGTIGGELTLKKEFGYPIATYQEMKRDAMQTILNSLSTLSAEDGAGFQILLRPAESKWAKSAIAVANRIRKNKGKKPDSLLSMKGVAEALWKPPEAKEVKPEDKQLSSLEQATVDAIEDKTRHPGYEVLIRVVASANTAARSQAVLKNLVAAFSVFDSPTKNGFKFTAAKNVEQFVTSFIFRFFPQEMRNNILNSVELATIFHFPDQRNTPTSQLQRQASKQVDGPTEMVEKGLLLGYNMFRGVKKEIRLGDVDRRRHAYIIGQTGTGKSRMLENLALQDMLDGKGFAFLDPHGDSAERLLAMVPRERVEDVIYFSPADMMDTPIGLNLFEFEDPAQRDLLIQEAIAMLYRLYDPGHTGIIGPRYEHWFRNAALTIMSDPAGASFIDIPQVFNDNDYSKAKLKYVTDQTVLDFWNKEMAQTSDYHKSEVLGWFVSKFGAFLSNEMMRNIIGQTKSGFDLRDIMDNKKILLINISKMGELNAQLMGMIFVMKFQAAAMGRANIPEEQRVDFTLYADEFQNFATESFEIILSQARKFRLSLVLANQFMTQLTDKIREAIIGNVGTVISGRIGTTDAELMVKKFAPVFDAEDLTKMPNFEAVASVMINNVPSSPFSMNLIPPLGQPNFQLAQALKRLSAAKYGRPRAEVEAEIFGRLKAGERERDERRQAALDRMRSLTPGAPSTPSAPGGTSKGDDLLAPAPGASAPGGGSSFLDEWLAKRKSQFGTTPKVAGLDKPPALASPKPLGQAPKAPPTDIGAPATDTPADAPIASQPAATEQPIKPAAPKVDPAKSLSHLEGQGFGGHITFKTTGPNYQPGKVVTNTDYDHKEIEKAIASTKADVVMQPEGAGAPPADNKPMASGDQGEINISRQAALDQAISTAEEQAEIDEIYIDVQGRLHHRSEDIAAAKKAQQQPPTA